MNLIIFFACRRFKTLHDQYNSATTQLIQLAKLYYFIEYKACLQHFDLMTKNDAGDAFSFDFSLKISFFIPPLYLS
jgi:hypothetical protein